MSSHLQNRLKSPIFWTAITAQILAILVFTNVIDVQVSNMVDHVICALLELLVTFGILNNPTNGDGL